jgi:polyhydroxyalkanoate synthesis regulator phasin
MPASVAAAREMQKHTPLRQPSSAFDEEQMEVSIGQLAGATEGGTADGAQHLGHLLDAVVEAGVAADGESKNVLGSVMKVAVLLDGELTPVRRSKQNADLADVDSFERAERRVAVKNLEEPQGNLNVHSIFSFSNGHIEENLGGVGISLGNYDNLVFGSVFFNQRCGKREIEGT